ncbi:MAG: M28 family metallopeptidase [Terriglobia bacterium]
MAGTPQAAAGFRLLPSSLIEQRLRAAPRANRERERAIKQMFEAAGCGGSRLREQAINSRGDSNLICTAPGQTSSVIIVGGHLDHVRQGAGIVDDWSGASLLPSLYQTLYNRPRRHTLIFVAFTDEEQGLVGSKRYVQGLSRAELHRIRAMVNLECLGLGAPEIWADHADPSLLPPLDAVAHSMATWIPRVNLEWVGRDDAMSFRHRKVPTITIHSLTQETVGVLHTRRDNLSAERMTYYYGTYSLVAGYLVKLDRTLP